MHIYFNDLELNVKGIGRRVTFVQYRDFWKTYGHVIPSKYKWLSKWPDGLYAHSTRPQLGSNRYWCSHSQRRVAGLIVSTITDWGDVECSESLVERCPNYQPGQVYAWHEDYYIVVDSPVGLRAINLQTGNRFADTSLFSNFDNAFRFVEWSVEDAVKRE